MIFGACVFAMNEKGEVLAVSRKDNPNDFGLPGGKVEPGETPAQAALRELLEETGYEVVDPRYAQIIYHGEHKNALVVTYDVPAQVLRKISTPKESGVVAWIQPEILIKGTFGEYNHSLLRALGFKFAMGADGSLKIKRPM